MWMVAALSLLTASCATAPGATVRAAPAPAPPPAQPTSTAVPTSGTGAALRMFGDTAPQGGAPVFFGMSNRLRDRADETPAALRHAAEQAARFRRIAARYRYVMRSTSGSIGYVDDIVVDYDDGDVETLATQLDVLRTEQDNEGTYVLARAPAVGPAPPISIGPGAGGQAPLWISRPPIISGYLVAVGVVERSARLRDSIDHADQDALKGLLTQARTTLRMIQEERSVDRVGTAAQVTAAQEARAVLQQFYIASRHVSADGRYVYSLAVGKE